MLWPLEKNMWLCTDFNPSKNIPKFSCTLYFAMCRCIFPTLFVSQFYQFLLHHLQEPIKGQNLLWYCSFTCRYHRFVVVVVCLFLFLFAFSFLRGGGLTSLLAEASFPGIRRERPQRVISLE